MTATASPASSSGGPRALVAGVGNLFLGDDGFGVEVVRRLHGERLPAGCEVADYGIRGLHLAFRLLEAVDVLVVVDLAPRGGAPGTLYVLEPDLDDHASSVTGGHGMDLHQVRATLSALGGSWPRVLLVGCEPACLDEGIGLSPSVEEAVEGAVPLVVDLLERELSSAPVPPRVPFQVPSPQDASTIEASDDDPPR